MSNDDKKDDPKHDPKDDEAAEGAEGGEEGAEGASAGDAKKNKIKKLVLIIVPIVVLLGGGAGLYFSGVLDSLLGKSHEAAGGEASGEGGEGGGKGGESEHSPTAVFMKLPDLIVNLNNDGQPRYLRLSVQLELNNEEDQKKVEAVLPRVVDQFQTYLRELRVEDLKGSKGIYRLQMELLARVNAAASPVEVKDVLFQEILIQ